MAEEGDYRALKNLVYLYDLKIADPAKEVYWRLMKVQNPEFQAKPDDFDLMMLGERYADGKGVAKDIRQACAYYKQTLEVRNRSTPKGFMVRDIVDKCTVEGMFTQSSLLPAPPDRAMM